MSKLKAYAVRDAKAEAFPRPPFFVSATGLAVRMFTDACNDPGTELGKYPADFTLFEIGDFDQQDGTFTPRKGGILDLGNGLNYLNTSERTLTLTP